MSPLTHWLEQIWCQFPDSSRSWSVLDERLYWSFSYNEFHFPELSSFIGNWNVYHLSRVPVSAVLGTTRRATIITGHSAGLVVIAIRSPAGLHSRAPPFRSTDTEQIAMSSVLHYRTVFIAYRQRIWYTMCRSSDFSQLLGRAGYQFDIMLSSICNWHCSGYGICSMYS